MIRETFDINEIIGIKLTEEREIDSYEWVDTVPEKRIFFGMIKVRSATPAGFLDLGSYRGTIYTEEELIGYGYKVYTTDERINSRVCRKPHVKIYLSHELTVDKVFETNHEAQTWIDALKATSGKTFETVVH
jgi:hypothetical protein